MSKRDYPSKIVDNLEDFEPQTEEIIGIVTDCRLLNVRKEANTDSPIICVIPALSEVMIDPTESTDEFYKVCTAAGVEGFCAKKYIVIK